MQFSKKRLKNWELENYRKKTIGKRDKRKRAGIGRNSGWFFKEILPKNREITLYEWGKSKKNKKRIVL